MKVWNKSFLVQFISSENIQISRKLHYLDPASASDKELPSRWLHFCSTVFFHFNGSFTYKMLFFPLKVRRNQFTERKKKSKANRNLWLEKGTSVFKNKFHKLDGSLRTAFQLGLVYLPGFLSSTKINLKSGLPNRDSDFKKIKEVDEYHSANSSTGDQWKSHCLSVTAREVHNINFSISKENIRISL